MTMAEERRPRDVELQCREKHNQRQMELLQSMVQSAVKRADNDKDVKVQRLTENDGIVAYLTTFERLMKAHKAKEEQWVFKLATNLVGTAQLFYAALNPEDAEP